MDDKGRHKRVRELVSKLNKERKKQAKKVDILCNDLVAAQKDFIKSLNAFSFAADFYELIIGTTDLNSLLCTAGKGIKEEISGANVAFFLRGEDKFELHLFESERPITLEKQQLENCFTLELVDSICKANKICRLEDLFAMGLVGNVVELNKLSAVTIPLGGFGGLLGFILIYRPVEDELSDEEINRIAAVIPGLSRAIQSCRVLLNSAN